MPRKLPRRRRSIATDTPSGSDDQSPLRNAKIDAKDITGLRFFKKIRPLLESLHKVGSERDTAGNRDLHMDQYCILVLMWLFNPVLTSLRGLQQASTLAEVQKRFGVGRASLGSLSESVSIFDPEPLKRIAEALATEVPSADPSRFDVIGKRERYIHTRLFRLLMLEGLILGLLGRTWDGVRKCWSASESLAGGYS